MKRLLSTFLIASLIASLVACSAFLGTGPHVPSAYQGTTKITIANASDAEICALSLFTGTAMSDNWLGEKSKAESIAPGGERSFDVIPGTYHVVAALFLSHDSGGSCTADNFLAGGGTGPNATVAINGPSLIKIGPNAILRIPGTKLIALPKFFNETGGVAASESAPAEESPSAPEEPAASGPPASSGDACQPNGAIVDRMADCCSREDKRTRDHKRYICCESRTDSSCQ